MSHQFVFRGPAREVELNHLQGAKGWFPADPETDEQTGDDGQVDLDRDAVVAVGQQMTATQDALEPAKEEFHGPAKTVAQGHQLGGEVETTGRQQQDVRTALSVGLAGIDFHNPHGLLEDTAALRAAEPNDAVATNAGGSGFRRQRSFFDDGPDGVVADATDEVAAGIDDVLEELILGIAAIDDVKPLGLQGLPQLFDFRVVAGRHGGFDGNAFEHVEMDVHFGGAVLGIEPQPAEAGGGYPDGDTIPGRCGSSAAGLWTRLSRFAGRPRWG